MQKEFQVLYEQAMADLEKVQTKDVLERFRVRYLGRKGALAKLTKKIKDLPVAARPAVGKVANTTKKAIVAAYAEMQKQLARGKTRGWIDFTRPGTQTALGRLHLVTLAIREIERIFLNLGFVRRRYPEVETDYYAFESLNMSPGHPARDEWETFFVEDPQSGKRAGAGKLVLTPHTSSGQVREMERHPLPIRMMNISKCYRRQIDISHTPMFHQFEGLVVDEGIQFVHLKGVLEFFCRSFFGKKRQIRLRPFHFRFTEPSFEVDVTCGLCGGKGCRYCKEGWSELGGAGMVHPHVLGAGGLDPQKVTGFAFGWGVERCYLMKEGLLIPDLRMFYQNDLRFLQQF